MVCVLLSTYNGDKYIEEQLNSLICQTYNDVMILVRDDGSTDNTIEILNNWQARGYLTWYSGKNIGPANSFMDLLKNAPDAEHYAFCDQDDVWLPQKISVAVARLDQSNEDTPALYISDTKVVDQDLNFMYQSHIDCYLTFGESLVRSVSTGCTNVFNRCLRNILSKDVPPYVEMHDKWVYTMCIALNGFVYYDHDAYILYRQHANNVLGANNKSLVNFIKRKYALFFSDSGGCERSSVAEYILTTYRSQISDENLALLCMISNYQRSYLAKLRLLFSSDLITKSFNLNLRLKLAILFNKY